MTNDHRKGWLYKLKTDANQRKRRLPWIRNPVERFRRQNPPGDPDRRCQSRSRTPHGGPLEVHHVGGLRRGARLVFFCRKHNREAEGMRLGGGRPKPGSSVPRSTRGGPPRFRRPW